MRMKHTGLFMVYILICGLLFSGMTACTKRAGRGPGLEEVTSRQTQQVTGKRSALEDQRIQDEDVSFSKEDKNNTGYDTKTAAFEDIHFDFDQFKIKPEAREILKRNYAILQSREPSRILIEGHCDEKGTVEYNLALGQRRSQATRNYLVDLGLNSDLIEIISFGEEKPLDDRHIEEAWQKNRRAHIMVIGE